MMPFALSAASAPSASAHLFFRFASSLHRLADGMRRQAQLFLLRCVLLYRQLRTTCACLSFSSLLSLAALAACASLLSACGGSGSAPGSTNGIPVVTTPPAGTPKLTLSLLNAQGGSNNTVSPESPLTVKATLVDGNGAALGNTIIEFGVGPNLVQIQPLSGSVVSDANGVASVTLQVKDAQTAQNQSGAADTIRVSASVGGKSVSSSAIFQIVAGASVENGAAPVLSVSLIDARGQISRTATPDNPLTALAKLVDAKGAPLPDVIISFTADTQLAVTTPLSGTALTNANGIASILLSPKDVLTAQNQSGAADTLRAAANVSGKSLTAQTVYQIGAASGGNASATLNLALLDSKGNTSRIASLDSTLTAQARLVDGNNQPVADAVVTFTNNSSLTTMIPATGSALTNSAGYASISLAPKDLLTAQTQSGAADTVRASSSYNGKTVNASAVYQMGATVGSTASATLGLSLLDARGQSSSEVTPTSPLIGKAVLLDAKGAPIPNALVSFSTTGTLALLSPASGSTLTDSQGVARITLRPKDLATAQGQSSTADTLKATATVGSNPLISSANFQLGSASTTLAFAAPGGPGVNLNAYESSTIKVDVLVNGLPYTNDPVTISFASTCASNGRASLPASAVTANGRAQVVYTDKGCAGADVLTASVNGAPVISTNIIAAAPAASSLGFVSAMPTEQAIVIKGAGGIGRSETATLTFVALDIAGRPLQNELINFTLRSTQPVTLHIASAITDTNGRVSTNVSSGTQPTTFRVIASYASNPAISTISGVVTVSNGVPAQSAFSLSASSSNIEGYTIDGAASTVGILLADASGNPVVDGTPVVFQTDSGAIGSSVNGGCVSSNGACTVAFRSQNPRYGTGNTANKRAGLATISASSSTATVNITGQIGIFLSGSFASNLYPYGGNTPYSQANNTLNNLSCGTYSLVVEVNDQNLNPMPVGTRLAVLNPSSDITAGTILPLTVPNVAPHDSEGKLTLLVRDMAPRQGSVHTIPLTLPNTCTPGGGTLKSATFTLSITSPSGQEVDYPFLLTYPVAP